MREIDQCGTYFLLPNESKGYEPDLFKETVFLWTVTHSYYSFCHSFLVKHYFSCLSSTTNFYLRVLN